MIWEIKNGDNRLWIVPFEIKNDIDLEDIYWTDHLTVFFSQEKFQNYEFNKYTKEVYSIQST